MAASLGAVLMSLLAALGWSYATEARSAPPASGKTEPDDERAERDAAAQALIRDNCLICHSEELLTGQQLTPAQWKAEVEKMVGWGAPLSTEQVAPLVAFLSERYSDSTPPPAPARISYEQASRQYEPGTLGTQRTPPRSFDRGAALYRAHCATCHGEDARGGDLGPNLVEVPVLLRVADYSALIRQGRHRMPGFQLVLNAEQENDVLAWLRQKRYDGPGRR